MSDNELKQKQIDEREAEPLFVKEHLSLKDAEYDKGRFPDFRIRNNNRTIGIEVTEMWPYKTKAAANNKLKSENALRDIIIGAISSEYVPFPSIDVILDNKIYCINKLKGHEGIKKEIKDILSHGKTMGSQYIKYFMPHTYPDARFNKNKISINFTWGGFQEPVSLKDDGDQENEEASNVIYNAISKKEKILSTKCDYSIFAEYWLCIALPLEERRFSIKNIKLPLDFHSRFDRIYLTQQIPPFALEIYNKSKKE